MSEPTLKKVQLVINKMTREQYSDLSARGEISPDLLYLLPEDEEKAIQEQVDGIEAKIPSAATSENQLADKAFVNSSINNYSAFYLTKNANGDAFLTHGEMLLTGKFYNAGVERIPTKNDYLIVLEDETKTTALGVNPTTRYVYQGEWPTGLFEFQYIVNNTALTQAQVDAINSGITKSIVDKMVVPSLTNPGYAANADTANTANTALSANYALDVKPFDASKITSGTIASARLPLATSSAQGAVKPVAKTAEMTQDVGVDSSGKLYTKPSSGGGGGGGGSGDDIYCSYGSITNGSPGWNFTSISNGETYIEYSQINGITDNSSKPSKIVGYFEITEADSQDYEIIVGTTGYDYNGNVTVENVSFVWKGNAGNNGNIKVPFIMTYNPIKYFNYIQVNGGYSTINMYITAIYNGGNMKGSFQ